MTMRYFYIGRLRDCGCAVVSSADIPGMEKETGKEVAAMIAKGLIVERVTGEVMAELFRGEGCTHAQLGQQKMELE